MLNKNVKIHLSSGGQATQNSRFLLQFSVNQQKGFIGWAVCFMNSLLMDAGSQIPKACALASTFYVVLFIAAGLVLGNVYVALKALSPERPRPQDRQLPAHLRCIWLLGSLPASCRRPRRVRRAEAHCVGMLGPRAGISALSQASLSCRPYRCGLVQWLWHKKAKISSFIYLFLKLPSEPLPWYFQLMPQHGNYSVVIGLMASLRLLSAVWWKRGLLRL